jgi:hypothetical protein
MDLPSYNPSTNNIVRLLTGFALLTFGAAHAQSNSNCFSPSFPASDRINACSQVIGSDPRHAQAYQSRAAAWFQLQDYDSAIADYTKGLNEIPTPSEAFRCLCFGRGLFGWF